MSAGPGLLALRTAAFLATLALSGLPGLALDRLDITVSGGSETLADAVNEASLTRSLQRQGQTDPQDLLAAARITDCP